MIVKKQVVVPEKQFKDVACGFQLKEKGSWFFLGNMHGCTTLFYIFIPVRSSFSFLRHFLAMLRGDFGRSFQFGEEGVFRWTDGHTSQTGFSVSKLSSVLFSLFVLDRHVI